MEKSEYERELILWSLSWTGKVGGKERECGYMNCGS